MFDFLMFLTENSYMLAAYIIGNTFNFLDHLAPFASLLKIPLILTEKEIHHLAQAHYPGLKTILHNDYTTFDLFLRTHFKGAITCSFSQTPQNKIISYLLQKPLVHIWMPHGNSDKRIKEKLFSLLKEEPIALLYGRKMLDNFKLHNVDKAIPHKFFIGNFRKLYFQKNQAFYQKIINRLLPFKKDSKTIFFAPSWGSEKHNLFVLKTLKYLLKNLPADFNLIIKPHPFAVDRLIYQLENLTAKKKNAALIQNFHAIYPLLDKTDFYLGDRSSIGYDFLAFDKPLFFLNYGPHKETAKENRCLFQAGTEILSEKEIFPAILSSMKKDPFQKQRKALYNYTFAMQPEDFQTLKQSLEEITFSLLQTPKEALQKQLSDLTGLPTPDAL